MKKIILSAALLCSMWSFGQITFMGIHRTNDSNGIEITTDISDLENDKHSFEVGGGITIGNPTNPNKNTVETLYFIGTKRITKYFSIGGKIGGLGISTESDKIIKTYYGLVSHLQLTGKTKGLIIGFGFDNYKQCTYGIGYKF